MASHLRLFILKWDNDDVHLTNLIKTPRLPPKDLAVVPEKFGMFR